MIQRHQESQVREQSRKGPNSVNLCSISTSAALNLNQRKTPHKHFCSMSPEKQKLSNKVHIEYIVEATKNYLKGYHSHQETDLI